MSLTSTPFLLYADENGNVFEDTSLYALGRSGWYADEVPLDDWIELPDGGSLYTLPDRIPYGKDVSSGEIRFCDKGNAVAFNAHHIGRERKYRLPTGAKNEHDATNTDSYLHDNNRLLNRALRLLSRL